MAFWCHNEIVPICASVCLAIYLCVSSLSLSLSLSLSHVIFEWQTLQLSNSHIHQIFIVLMHSLVCHSIYSFSSATKRFRPDDSRYHTASSNDDRHSLSDSSDKPRTPDSRSISPASTNSNSPIPEFDLHLSHRPEVFNRMQPDELSHSSNKSMDMLTRIFPTTKRNVLQLVLQGCNGDVVQAIDQILTHPYEQQVKHSQPQSPAYSAPVFHQQYYGTPLDSFKSAFTPAGLTTLPSVHHYNSLRYALGGATGLNSRTPFSLPSYTPVMPSVGVTPGYSNTFSGLTSSVPATCNYPACPCGGEKTFTASLMEKRMPRIGESWSISSTSGPTFKLSDTKCYEQETFTPQKYWYYPGIGGSVSTWLKSCLPGR